jgi:hypothetical protein
VGAGQPGGVAKDHVIGNHGPVHPSSQARRQARQLAGAGNLSGARSVLENAVEQMRPALATGDSDVLETMRELAALHSREDDPTGARRLLEEAYAAGQHTKGPSEPLMVLLAYDLAVVAEELANRHEARKNFALVAEHGPAALGETHPAVSHARDYATDGLEAPPASGPPASGPPASGPPISGPPASGPPASGPPASGPPASGPPVLGPPASGPPALGGSAGAEAATAPLPAYGSVSGPPAYGVPVSGASVSAAPAAEHFGGAAAGRTKRSPLPWLITSAALVFAVIMLAVVFLRPDEQATTDTIAADTTPAPAAPLPESSVTPSLDASSAAPSASASASAAAAPSAAAPAKTTKAPAAAKTTTKPPAAAVTTRITSPRSGAGVSRNFNVAFTASAADLAATGTKLALTVCVSDYCFLDGPVVIKNGKAETYSVTLGSAEGKDVGEKWVVRVDRFTTAQYAALAKQKQDAANAGTWGNGVSTPKDKLNPTPVSAVTVTKTS